MCAISPNLQSLNPINNPQSAFYSTRIALTPSLWCSAACPEGSTPRFAVGTSQGLHTIEGFGSYWSLSKKPFANDVVTGKPVPHRKMDSSHALVTSVEWLSSDVIAGGLLDSTVFLHDLRSGGTATRLQHTHAVSKIRKVDPYRLVVAGLNSVRLFLPLLHITHSAQKRPPPSTPI